MKRHKRAPSGEEGEITKKPSSFQQSRLVKWSYKIKAFKKFQETGPHLFKEVIEKLSHCARDGLDYSTDFECHIYYTRTW